MIKHQWLEICDEPLCEQSIRSLHIPAGNYRISPGNYLRGATFTGSQSVPTIMYLLEGSCKITLNGEEMILQAQEFVKMEAGRYIFEVLGTAGVKVISVFELPLKFRKPVDTDA